MTWILSAVQVGDVARWLCRDWHGLFWWVDFLLNLLIQGLVMLLYLLVVFRHDVASLLKVARVLEDAKLRLVSLLVETAKAHRVLRHRRKIDIFSGFAQSLPTIRVVEKLIVRLNLALTVRPLSRAKVLQLLGRIGHRHRLVELHIILNYRHLLRHFSCFAIFWRHVLRVICGGRDSLARHF